MAKHVIIINNRRYDAVTGDLLPHQDTRQAAPKPRAAPAKTAVPHQAATHPKKPEATPRAAASRRKTTVRPAAHHAPAHAPKPSQTLMRKAVKKPAATLRPQKAQGHLDKLAKQPLHRVIVKHSAKKLDTTRLREAKRVRKSRLVNRFSAVTSDANNHIVFQPLAVQPEPSGYADRAAAARAHAAAARQTFLPASKPKTTAELLEYALQQATAHQEPFREPARRHRFKRLARATA